MSEDAQPKRRNGRGTLHIIAGLLIASGILRLGSEAGQALANSAPEEPEHEVMQTMYDMSENHTESETDMGALLEAFQTREARLVERESQLTDRLRALQVAEEQIDVKLVALNAAEERLSATIALADSASESDLSRLTLVYENMKPKDAAALFEEMPPEFAAGFLGLMSPESAALIMTELEPTTAYSFSVVLAGRNADVPTQ